MKTFFSFFVTSLTKMEIYIMIEINEMNFKNTKTHRNAKLNFKYYL